MKQITKDNLIFQSKEFLKDKYKFGIILKNLNSPTLELYSDEENYIICRGSVNWPTWIWTKENVDISKLSEIEQLINKYLLDIDRTKFTCKKELYDLLVQDNFETLNIDDYFEMGFLVCKNTTQPKSCDGTLSIPNEQDRKALEEYWYNDNQEMNSVDKITKEQAIKDVDWFLTSGKFYVLRNPENRIVSMASFSITENIAKLSHVYTPIEERGKGYAANLIYQITNKLLEQGYVPLLYTDYSYVPSNKAYINAGYEPQGILINFSCSKSKLRSK